MKIPTRESLVERELTISKLLERIDKVRMKGGFIKFFSLSDLESQLEMFEDLQFYQTDSHLFSTDPDYTKIANDTYELLKTGDIEFVSYTTDYSLHGTYAECIEGRIHDNGYSYSETTKTNLLVLPFDSFRFPAEMKGKVDYWGRLDLKTTKTGHAVFKTLPKRFKGSVGADGRIEILNVENESEILSGGHLTMGKLIADHFDDELKRERFLQNKQILTDKIGKLRNTFRTAF